MNIVNDVIATIRRLRSINNFKKDQSESNTNELNIIFLIASYMVNFIFSYNIFKMS